MRAGVSVEDAKGAALAVAGESTALGNALDILVEAVRNEGAGIARSFKDPNPLASIFEPWVGERIAAAVQNGGRK